MILAFCFCGQILSIIITPDIEIDKILMILSHKLRDFNGYNFDFLGASSHIFIYYQVVSNQNRLIL